MNTEKKVDKLSKYAVFVMLITLCFGEYFKLLNISLTWLSTLLVIYLVMFEFAKNPVIDKLDKSIFFLAAFSILWLLYAFMQLFIAQSYSYWMFGFKILAINMFLTLILIYHIKTIEDIIFYSKAFIISLMIHLAIAFWEIQTKRHLFEIPNPSPWELYTPRTTYANINDCATVFLLCLSMLFLHWFLTHKYTILTIILTGLTFYIINEIESRAILLGTMILVVGWLAIKLCWFASNYSERHFKILFFIGAVVICISAFVIVNSFGFIETISSAGNEESDKERVDIIKEGIKLFKGSYFLGIGPGQSLHHLGNNLHNFVIEISAENGIFIFTGILYIYLNLFYTAFNNKILLPDNVKFYITTFSVAFIPISISSSSIFRIRAFWLIFIIMFLTVRLGVEQDKINEKKFNY